MFLVILGYYEVLNTELASNRLFIFDICGMY